MKKRGLAGAVVTLSLGSGLPTFAQQRVIVRGAFSITMENDFGRREKAYGGVSATTDQRWTLRLGGGDPSTAFALCYSHDDQVGSCMPNFGHTDQYGNWTLAGPFGASSVGDWTQWIQFPSGAISNRISFSVGRNFSGALTLNGGTAGVFHVGQPWNLLLTSGFGLGQPFDLCAEWNGTSVSCTPNVGTFDSNARWSNTGAFSLAELGGWTLWARLPNGNTTQRISFVVDDSPLDDRTCANGTIYPAGPNAGYDMFQRYTRDWYPTTDSYGFTMLSDHPGGIGNTLQYTGCSGANFVWLQWAYGGLATFAVRAPWNGQTDRGLRMADTMARFQSLYPAAHRWASNLFPLWPMDLDVWDAGPLKVAFRKGLVAMIQVDWFGAYPADDLLDSTSLGIGPYDTGILWQ